MISKYRYLELKAKYNHGKKNIYPEPRKEPLKQSTTSFPPAHGTYGGLLFDQRWRRKRAEILERDSNRCVICKNWEDLQVHHRQYHYSKMQKKFKAPWDYSNNLLITLCKSCHNRGHNQFKVPIISI